MQQPMSMRLYAKSPSLSIEQLLTKLYCLCYKLDMETLETNTIEQNATNEIRYGQDITWPTHFTEEDIATVRPMVINMLADNGWTPELFADQPEKFDELLTSQNNIADHSYYDMVVTSPKFTSEHSGKPVSSQDMNTTGELRWPAYFTEEEIAMVKPSITEMLATGDWTPQMLEEQNKFSQALKFAYDAKNPESGGAFMVTSPNFAPQSIEETKKSFLINKVQSIAKRLIACVVNRPGDGANQDSSQDSSRKQ